MKELQDRLTELEIRFTHQARIIEELNHKLTDCNQRLSRLERENRSFREMLQKPGPHSHRIP